MRYLLNGGCVMKHNEEMVDHITTSIRQVEFLLFAAKRLRDRYVKCSNTADIVADEHSMRDAFLGVCATVPKCILR